MLGTFGGGRLVLVGSLGQRGLSSGSSSVGLGSFLTFLSLFEIRVLENPGCKVPLNEGGKRNTYTTSTADTTTTATSATTATAATTGALATFIAAGALAATGSTFLSLRGLWLASELHRDLTGEDLLTGESLDGGSGFSSSGQIDERIANGAVGARVHRNRGALARSYESVTSLRLG